jgi:putative FmdB family regulatory protein
MEECAMPIYRYKCNECGHEFTELRKYENKHDPIACPVCGGQASFVYSPFMYEIVASTGISKMVDTQGNVTYHKRRDWTPPPEVLAKFKNNIAEYDTLVHEIGGSQKQE